MKDDKMFYGKRILITGGTGSLGHVLTHRLLDLKYPPKSIGIFSRDEAKQHAMRLHFKNISTSTDEIIYSNFLNKVIFMIGDVRDKHSVAEAIRGIDIIFHTSAIKQVPVAEYFPHEAIKTNVIGTSNVILSIVESREPVESVIGISTDKACQPINAYGMTKALLERLFISANIRCEGTKFLLARYGNVMGTTGSVLPLFKNQIDNKKSITVTSKEMTRYMMDINHSVDTIFHTYKNANIGEIVIPKVPSARIIDVAEIMAEGTESNVEIVGIRPGEKLHELLINEQEMPYAYDDNKGYYRITSMLPEFSAKKCGELKIKEYSSNSDLMNKEEVYSLLKNQGWVK